MCWNIEGLQNKLDNCDILNYLKQFDIHVVALLETWKVENSDVRNILCGYTSFEIPAFKYENVGRPMCGIIVYVKNHIMQFVHRIQSDCKFALFLKLEKSVNDTSKDVLFSFTYLPPETSYAYKYESVKGIDMLENYLLTSDIDLNEVLLTVIAD